jgi:virulence-associated protein VagC
MGIFLPIMAHCLLHDARDEANLDRMKVPKSHRGVPVLVEASGSGQKITIPEEFHFQSSSVSISRHKETGGLLLVEFPSIEDVFTALDEAQIPEDFLAVEERDQRIPAQRGSLGELAQERNPSDRSE